MMVGSGSAVVCFKRANRDEVAVANVAHVVDTKRQQSLRATGGGYELNFKRFRRQHFHHRAEIAAPQSCLGQVTGKSNGVE